MNSKHFSRAWILSLALLLTSGLASAESAETLYNQALEQDDMRALRTLDRARRLSPNNDRILFRIGFLLHKMNRRQEASEAYTSAIRVNPCHSRALNNLGNIELDSGEPGKAEQLYRRAIACDANFHSPHYNLANILGERGRATEAVRHYEAALAINPEHSRTHHNLGLLYMQIARSQPRPAESPEYAKAKQHLLRSIALNPQSPVARFNAGQLLELGNEPGPATAEYEAALRLLPNESAMKSRVRRRLQALQLQSR